MAHTMTPEEVRAFLMAGTRTAKIASTRADGRPHVAPVWFVLDGDDVIFTTGADSVKGRTLHRDPRVSICVDDQAPPFSFVVIEGTAALSEDLDALRHWATRIAARYVGADRAEEASKGSAVPGELLVRVTPTKVTATANLAE